MTLLLINQLSHMSVYLKINITITGINVEIEYVYEKGKEQKLVFSLPMLS